MKATLSKILIYTLLSVVSIFLVWYEFPASEAILSSSGDKSETVVGTNEFFQDFESGEGSVSTENPFHGKYAGKLGSGDFSPAFTLKISDYPDPAELKKISLEARVCKTQDEQTNFVFVVTISNQNGDNLLWDAIYTDTADFKKNVWTKLNGELKLPEDKLFGDNILKAFIWNQSGSALLVDDLKMTVGKVYEKPGNAGGFCDILNKNCVRCKGDLLAPPYPIKYAKNTSAKSLIASAEIDQVICGNFDESHAGDEILTIKDGKISLQAQSGNDWKSLLKSSVSKDSKVISKGRFFGKTTAEVLIKQGKQLSILQFTNNTVSVKKVPGQHEVLITGELNASGHDVILSVNPGSGEATLIDPVTMQLSALKVVGADLRTAMECSAWLNWTGGGKQIGVFTGKENVADLHLLTINGGELKAQGSPISIGTTFSKYGQKISAFDKFFEFPGVAGVFQHSSDWRFELKNLQFGKGPAIFYRVDFAESIDNNNPKFYEHQQIQSFVRANGQAGLLVASSFSKAEPSLPNKLEIYEIAK